MANKISNISYDQIPHIVINHPDTSPEHKEIMRALFKVLKDVSKPIIYTNESLSENCRISLRNVERRIPELVKMGFINCTGRGFSRRISLGILFTNSANMAVEENAQPPKSTLSTAKSDPSNRQYGGHYNPYTNPSSKADHFSLTSKPKTPPSVDLLRSEYNNDCKTLIGLGLKHKIKDFEIWLLEKNR